MSTRSEPHTLHAGELSATYHPEAGMVCSSLTREGRELLALRAGLEAYVEAGKTFGIPFLHPWANRLSRDRFELGGREVDVSGARRDPGGAPIHGMLTASPDWRVEAAGGRAIVARHAWDGARLKAFPFPHDVELAVTLAPEGLTVTTTVSATAEVDVPVAFGFHPYVALPPGDRAGARVALPVRRRQLVDDRGLPTGAHEDVEPVRGPLGEATYDDCFDRLEPGRPFVADGEHERLSVLPTSGYSVAQVFAPPGKPLVCFEPMVAPVDALVTGDGLAWARPGMPYVAVWSLGVVPR